jgi:hypothetical protein
MRQSRGVCIFQPPRNLLKILGAREWHKSKSHNKDPQILSATTQNLVTRMAWNPGLMHPCSKVLQQLPVQGKEWWDALLISNASRHSHKYNGHKLLWAKLVSTLEWVKNFKWSCIQIRTIATTGMWWFQFDTYPSTTQEHCFCKFKEGGM